jgi:hypothetical protein
MIDEIERFAIIEKDWSCDSAITVSGTWPAMDHAN